MYDTKFKYFSFQFVGAPEMTPSKWNITAHHGKGSGSQCGRD